MAQYRIDPEQEAALASINNGLNSVRTINRLLLAEEDFCVSLWDSQKRRKRGESETGIVVDAAQKDRILSVLAAQRARIIREIMALAKKHDIELDEDEKAAISVSAISRHAEQKQEKTA